MSNTPADDDDVDDFLYGPASGDLKSGTGGAGNADSTGRGAAEAGKGELEVFAQQPLNATFLLKWAFYSNLEISFCNEIVYTLASHYITSLPFNNAYLSRDP